MWLFLAFLASFGVKAAVWPLHTWLPDAYGEAPLPGTIMLAAVLSKMGAYGFLRFAVPMLPAGLRRRRAADVHARRRRGDLYLASSLWRRRT